MSKKTEQTDDSQTYDLEIMRFSFVRPLEEEITKFNDIANTFLGSVGRYLLSLGKMYVEEKDLRKASFEELMELGDELCSAKKNVGEMLVLAGNYLARHLR